MNINTTNERRKQGRDINFLVYVYVLAVLLAKHIPVKFEDAAT